MRRTYAIFEEPVLTSEEAASKATKEAPHLIFSKVKKILGENTKYRDQITNWPYGSQPSLNIYNEKNIHIIH